MHTIVYNSQFSTRPLFESEDGGGVVGAGVLLEPPDDSVAAINKLRTPQLYYNSRI